jgi:hypothetical protein
MESVLGTLNSCSLLIEARADYGYDQKISRKLGIPPVLGVLSLTYLHTALQTSASPSARPLPIFAVAAQKRLPATGGHGHCRTDVLREEPLVEPFVEDHDVPAPDYPS